MRQQATGQLLTDNQSNLDQITQLYAHAKLPEQNHRLLNAARHHAIRQMIRAKHGNKGQGAIGITHGVVSANQSTAQGQPGVIVIDTFPGFPGHAYLQRGDIILSIDGVSFPPSIPTEQIAEHFVASVKRHPPGTTVHFSVFRNGHALQLQFPLASLDALKSAYNSPGNLQQPFLDEWLMIRRQLLNAHRPKQQSSNPQLVNPNTRTNKKDMADFSKDRPAGR